MAANTSPIFTVTPLAAWATLTTGTNTYTGTSGTNVVYTAGSAGGYLSSIICKAAGTNVASVLRIFINNGSTSGTAANNSLAWEVSLPATTATAVAATQTVEFIINKQIPASYTVIVVLATTVAAGWQVTGIGGSY